MAELTIENVLESIQNLASIEQKQVSNEIYNISEAKPIYADVVVGRKDFPTFYTWAKSKFVTIETRIELS